MIAMERGGGVPNSCFHVIKNFWAIHAFFKIFFFFKENYSVKFSTDNDRPKLNNRVIQTNPREGLFKLLKVFFFFLVFLKKVLLSPLSR